MNKKEETYVKKIYDLKQALNGFKNALNTLIDPFQTELDFLEVMRQKENTTRKQIASYAFAKRRLEQHLREAGVCPVCLCDLNDLEDIDMLECSNNECFWIEPKEERLFIYRCLGCGEVLGAEANLLEKMFCKTCYHSIFEIKEVVCEECARPFVVPQENKEPFLCVLCKSKDAQPIKPKKPIEGEDLGLEALFG